jgi:hypothetical protein
MDFDALAPGGLARRARRALADALENAAPSGAVSSNPAEVLALLMDFSGSVALAKVLHAPAPARDEPSHPDAAARAAVLQTRVQEPLDGKRAPAVPAPPALFETLARHTGAPGVRPQGAAVLQLAHELGTPLIAALGTCLRQSQAHIAAVRHELTPELHQLGPRARRLERIDAALQRSIATKVAQLFVRMELAAELTFERACAEACAALPEAFALEELATWAADSGWIAGYRRRCLHVARGYFDHLRRGLEALLMAASEAEVES